MSTTTKKICFTTAIGGGVSITKSIVGIYRIKGQNPDLLFTKEVNTPDFELDVQIDDAYYYYVTLVPCHYTLEGKTFETKYLDKDGTFVTLLSVFDAMQQKVVISPQSTIATAFAFNRMINITSQGETLISESAGTGVAFGMKNNFIFANGTISPLIASSPNGLETNSFAMFNYLSSMLYYCLTDYGIYTTFINYTTGNQHISGLMNLIRNPFDKVTEIYDLISNKPQIFTPSLSTLTLPANKSNVPNQWTLTIKANLTGADNFCLAAWHL